MIVTTYYRYQMHLTLYVPQNVCRLIGWQDFLGAKNNTIDLYFFKKKTRAGKRNDYMIMFFKLIKGDRLVPKVGGTLMIPLFTSFLGPVDSR
jgi:hypothetical protein